MTHLMHTYNRLKQTFTKGKGVWLYDNDGRAYLDALSGIAVCGLGHAHPELTQALYHQAKTLWHTSNLFPIPAQEQAAQTLCELSGMQRAFFCNSGTEANEAALKLTRLHARKHNIEHPIVISFTHSFHGRTFGAMSATGNPKIQQGFAPLLPQFLHLPYNDLEALMRVSDNANIVAILLECVQGEGGIHLIDPQFIQHIRQLCTQHNWLMIVDDIQAGMGRTGKWFSYQHYSLTPDVLTLAKGLGNGLPVGACLARGSAAELFQAGNHGTTFGGSPLIMHVVNTLLQIYQRDQLIENAQTVGAYLLSQLQQQFNAHPNIAEIRGQGLMLGIELKQSIDQLAQKALHEQQLVLNVTAEKVIRLVPALIFSKDNADELIKRLHALLTP